ncbi:hypothetical protein D3C87_1762740 [compost metagenome]|jgi:hypothetical protein
MKTTTWRASVARWPGMALMALALHASGQAEAGAGFGGYASPAQQYALALEAQTRGDQGLFTLKGASHEYPNK